MPTILGVVFRCLQYPRDHSRDVRVEIRVVHVGAYISIGSDPCEIDFINLLPVVPDHVTRVTTDLLKCICNSRLITEEDRRYRPELYQF